MIDDMRATIRYLTMFIFNLLPIVMVAANVWRPFDVMAFYWVELIAIGGFAMLKFLIAAMYDLYHSRYGSFAGCVAGLVFFPLHYGFFIIMICFLVGGYLPPDTPTRTLDSPLVPMQVVIENVAFADMLLLTTLWQAGYFCTDFLFPRAYEQTDRSIFVMRPYASLFYFIHQRIYRRLGHDGAGNASLGCCNPDNA